MINDDDNVLILKKKVEYFCKFKKPVHISLITGKWLNGNIIEYGADYFLLVEFKEGEMPVFYQEIFPNGIEEFKGLGG